MTIFICMIPFHFYLFKNIAKYLNDNYEFLIPTMVDKKLSIEYGGGMSAKGLYNYNKSFLNQKGVKISEYGDANIKNLIDYINNNAKNIVCPHKFDGIDYLYNVRIILLSYAIPEKIAYSFELIYLMDLIMTYGQESAEWISQKNINAVFIGNPLLDDWFKNEINNEDTNIIKQRSSPGKKTILYLPTWGKASSIDLFLEEISSLADEYNIVIKLHHCTFNGEANRLCRCLSFPNIIVLGDYFDPLPLYKLSDIVITDGLSGATFDALALDKPILTLGNSIDNYGIGANTSVTNILYSIPFISDPEKLRISVKKIIQDKFVLDHNTKYALFYSQDGQAGKRAAEVINDDKRYPKITMLKKYDRAIKQATNSKQRQDFQDKKYYFLQRYYPEQIKKPSIISRIYKCSLKLLFNKNCW